MLFSFLVSWCSMVLFSDDSVIIEFSTSLIVLFITSGTTSSIDSMELFIVVSSIVVSWILMLFSSLGSWIISSTISVLFSAWVSSIVVFWLSIALFFCDSILIGSLTSLVLFINSGTTSSIDSIELFIVVSSVLVSWISLEMFDDLSLATGCSLIFSKLPMLLTVIVSLEIDSSKISFIGVTFLTIGFKEFFLVLVLFLFELALELFFAR